jgi:hypothetical protein
VAAARQATITALSAVNLLSTSPKQPFQTNPPTLPRSWAGLRLKPLRPERLPLRLLRVGLENLGYELEKRVFPFEGLRLAICRGGFDNEQRAVLAARPLDT